MPQRKLKTNKKTSLKSAVTKTAVSGWLWHSSFSANSQTTPSDLPLIRPEGLGQHDMTAFDNPRILARNVFKSPKACFQKNTGTSQGRKCTLDGVMHYMKYANNQTNYRFQEVYNLLLLKDLLNIQIPQFGFFQDKQKLYFATQEIPKLELADTLIVPDGFGQKGRAAVGELGVAQITVASTLIPDLRKLQNWGISPHGVVIIDADGGLQDDGSNLMPKTAADYFQLANDSVQQHDETLQGHVLKHLNFKLSLNNIVDMKKIYESMLTKELPNVDPSVNLNKELFRTVINVYIKACENILTNSAAFADPTHPEWDINHQFGINVNRFGQLIPVSAIPNFTVTAQTTQPKSLTFFAPDDLAVAVAASTASTFIKNAVTEIPKVISTTSDTDAPSSFLQKNEMDMQALIFPILASSGVLVTAAAFIYTLWKRYNKVNAQINPKIASSPTNSKRSLPLTEIAVTSSPRKSPK